MENTLKFRQGKLPTNVVRSLLINRLLTYTYFEEKSTSIIKNKFYKKNLFKDFKSIEKILVDPIQRAYFKFKPSDVTPYDNEGSLWESAFLAYNKSGEISSKDLFDFNSSVIQGDKRLANIKFWGSALSTQITHNLKVGIREYYIKTQEGKSKELVTSVSRIYPSSNYNWIVVSTSLLDYDPTTSKWKYQGEISELDELRSNLFWDALETVKDILELPTNELIYEEDGETYKIKDQYKYLIKDDTNRN